MATESGKAKEIAKEFGISAIVSAIFEIGRDLFKKHAGEVVNKQIKKFTDDELRIKFTELIFIDLNPKITDKIVERLKKASLEFKEDKIVSLLAKLLSIVPAEMQTLVVAEINAMDEERWKQMLYSLDHDALEQTFHKIGNFVENTTKAAGRRIEKLGKETIVLIDKKAAATAPTLGKLADWFERREAARRAR